jgi:hypothetical protein
LNYAVYMVDRDLPGIKMEQLAAAQKAAIELGKKMTAEGKKGTLHPQRVCTRRSALHVFFEAANPEVVKELNETAKIPFKRIVEAMDLTPK